MALVVVACDGGRLDAGWNRVSEEPVRLDEPDPIETAPADSGATPANELPALDAGEDSALEPEPQEAGIAPGDAGSAEPQTLLPVDAGFAEPQTLLPVDASNPVILSNDGPRDNWQAEYAFLLAQAGGPEIAGIVVGSGRTWPNLDENFSGWQELVSRARESGLVGIPDPVRSEGQPLQRPADGNVDSTVPSGSEGARFIVEKSLELATPELPVVVATGGALTDVADAYLLDPTIAERIVVVASLGSGFSEAEQVARMGIPNGEMDTWAGAIVISKLRYVQASAFYEGEDVPADRLAELPDNAFGEWMRAKQPGIWQNPITSDQVSVLAFGLPAFAVGVERISQSGWEGDQPTLAADANGQAWLVTASNGASAISRFWELLGDPATFGL